MSKQLNVHEYDGKLGESYLELVNWDTEHLQPAQPFEEAMKEVSEFVIGNTSEKEMSSIKNLLNMLSTQHKSNFDSSNKIDFEDIMPRVWRFYRLVDDPDDKLVFAQQIADIRKGTCPQGRAGARLYQLYFLWIDHGKSNWKSIDEPDKEDTVLVVMKKLMKEDPVPDSNQPDSPHTPNDD